MLVKKQKKYLNAIISDMLHYIRVFVKKHDLKELHHLRVGIKKINAFLFMFGCPHESEDFKEALTDLQKIYKRAGKIRDRQITDELLCKYSGKTISRKRSDEQKKATESFCGKSDFYSRKLKGIRNILVDNLTDLGDDVLLELFEGELLKLNTALLYTHEVHNMHQCRKKLKLLIYNHKCLSSEAKKKINLNVSYLKELEKNIGQWHDMDMLLKMLSEPEYHSESEIEGISAESKKLFDVCKTQAEHFIDKSFKRKLT